MFVCFVRINKKEKEKSEDKGEKLKNVSMKFSVEQWKNVRRNSENCAENEN